MHKRRVQGPIEPFKERCLSTVKLMGLQKKERIFVGWKQGDCISSKMSDVIMKYTNQSRNVL